jgi:cytokinesis protein
LLDIRKGLGELREGLKRIRHELNEHFADIGPEETYGRIMWTFVGKASAQLEDLTDDVNAAEATFNQVIKHYGEDDKNPTSLEFYGIFKTFVTSYRV